MPIEMLSRIGRMLYGIGSALTGAKVRLPRFFPSFYATIKCIVCTLEYNACCVFSRLMNSWTWLNVELRELFIKYVKYSKHDCCAI